MSHRIEMTPGYHLIGMPHRGAYYQIGAVWRKMMPLAGEKGLFHPEMLPISAFFDDYRRVPEPELRSFAGITVAPGTKVPEGFEAVNLPGGKYAVTTYVGPYSGLPTAWKHFNEALVAARLTFGSGPCFEVYLDDMSKVPAEKLRTDIYISLA